MKNTAWSCLFTLVTIMTLASLRAFADFGVADNEIVLGTVNAQSGPASDLGQELNLGARAYIENINKSFKTCLRLSRRA